MDKKKKGNNKKEKRSTSYSSAKQEMVHEFSEELADGGERNEIIEEQQD
ncbi:hypothetical protein [Bacillus sp. SA1-12]|nr:hypothetical protein [Bacillus sp. SA1-12]